MLSNERNTLFGASIQLQRELVNKRWGAATRETVFSGIRAEVRPLQLLKSYFSYNFFNFIPTASTKMGVDVQVIAQGDGQTYPKTGQTVVVHYTGTLENGVKFDSSRDRSTPFKFRLGRGEVIKGWDQGVAQMCVGERARLTCSPDFAYGSRGHPGIIPPNAVLIFDVELLKVEP